MTSNQWVRTDPTWIKAGNALTERALPQLGHSCDISMPFLGIDGAGRAMMEAGWPFKTVNAIDNNEQVQMPLYRLHGDSDEFKCCDITTIDFDQMKSSEGFIGTAPCQDFSLMLTSSPGLGGLRGRLFMCQLEMIKHLAERKVKPLKWCCMETVAGFMAARNTSASPCQKVEEWWAINMPSWIPLQVWKVNLLDSSSPGSRHRCVMVSFPRFIIGVVGRMPAPPPKHPHVSFEDFLEEYIPEPEPMSPAIMENSKGWTDKFATMCEEKGKQHALGTVDVSRKVVSGFNTSISMDRCGILTTNNRNLFLLSHNNPADRFPSAGRYLTMKEKAQVQGVVIESLDGMSTHAMEMALGNMWPVNLAGVCIRQIMEVWESYENKIMQGGLCCTSISSPSLPENVPVKVGKVLKKPSVAKVKERKKNANTMKSNKPQKLTVQKPMKAMKARRTPKEKEETSSPAEAALQSLQSTNQNNEHKSTKNQTKKRNKKSKKHIAAAIEEIVSKCKQADLEGIDIDAEQAGIEDKQAIVIDAEQAGIEGNLGPGEHLETQVETLWDELVLGESSLSSAAEPPKIRRRRRKSTRRKLVDATDPAQRSRKRKRRKARKPASDSD
jgi:site-specific DNA-cytosine methylase